jgi:hypothetical protein
VSKLLRKARLEMRFDDENESFNAEFTRGNILVKGMSISI